MRISKTDVIEWLRTLYQNGIRKYYHSDLPDEYKNEAYHKKAMYCKLIIHTGNMKGKYKEYAIIPNIMIINQWLRCDLYGTI